VKIVKRDKNELPLLKLLTKRHRFARETTVFPANEGERPRKKRKKKRKVRCQEVEEISLSHLLSAKLLNKLNFFFSL
jgi:hypothetical protein